MSQPDQSHPPRILAAGLSPAWQQIMVFDQFAAGQVNRACEVHWCASGKVLNVGIALAHLGTTDGRYSSRVLSVIGAHARAAIDREFAELGVDCRWIETCAQTRICTTIVERGVGRTTELVENALPLTIEEVERFREAFAEEAARADVVILTGSLPPVAASLRDASSSLEETRPRDAFYRELLQTTRARAVLDIRGPELLAALDCQPFCVKPNREELAATLGRDLASEDDLHAAMRELNNRGALWVVVTQGADTIWVTHDGKLHRFQPPRVEHVVNPIGSGDCLAAGIAWATASGRDMLDAIYFGIAAAVDNVGQLLPARLDSCRIAELQHRITRVV